MSLLAKFCTWAKDHGVNGCLVPKESKGMGVGLFADSHNSNCSDDQEGELLFVPSSVLLSRSLVMDMNCGPLQKTFKAIGMENVTERIALVLFLLYERVLVERQHCGPPSTPPNETPLDSICSSDSVFADYVAILPIIRTPVTLDPETARGYLAGTLLLDSVCAKRAKLETEFEALSGKLGVFEHWPVHPSLDNFIWADATFWSRVLSFKSQWGHRLSEDHKEDQDQDQEQPQDHAPPRDDMHMVPYLDFANHAAKPNIRWQVDTDGLRVWHNEEFQDNKSDKQEKSDDHAEEMFLSYGNKPNMELLFLYGFTLPNNPTQHLTLAMPMDEDDPYYMPKAHTLMRLGIPPRITLYTEKSNGPANLVELGHGVWVNPEAQYLLWIYALNEEDGLSALIEEPDIKLCVPRDGGGSDGDSSDENMEEADLVDEDTVGRLILSIQKKKIMSKELLQAVIPKLEIYPILALRSLALVTERVEYYIARIMETGDKLQKAEHNEIVYHANYDSVPYPEGEVVPTQSENSEVSVASRLGRNIGDCLLPTLLEPDHEHPITSRQLEIEVQISNLVSTMRNYRTEEMDELVLLGNVLGEAQRLCLEENTYIQDYLARMQTHETE